MKHLFAVVIALPGIVAASLAAASEPPPGSGGTLPAPRCAFPFIVDKAHANVAFPDTNATYWVMPLTLTAGDGAVITGTFPYARYMSFNSYTTDGKSTGAIHDAKVLADVGSSNPFTPGVAQNASPRAYRVQVNLTDNPQDESPVAGALDMKPGGALLVYRVYVPDDTSSAAGGEPLPSITVTPKSGQPVTLAPCTSFHQEPGIDLLAAPIVRQTLDSLLPPASQPEFVLPAYTGGLFPNEDNKYVYAATTWEPGRLIVVRGKAPTYPDTRAQPIYPEQQLRYWSLCTNITITPGPVVQCAGDNATARDASERYVYVIGADQDQPTAAALASNNGTWLSWFGPAVEALHGEAQLTGSLILRNMLPASTFTHAIQNIPDSNSNPAARATMGEYYPEAVYCDRGVLEGPGGVDACFANVQAHGNARDLPRTP